MLETLATNAPVFAAALSGFLGTFVGAITALVTVRLSIRKDKRDEGDEKRKQEAAENSAQDRLVELLKDQNRLALDNAKLQYEIALQNAMSDSEVRHRLEMDRLRTSLKTEMAEQINDALNTYGCELAPDCKDHTPRRRG